MHSAARRRRAVAAVGAVSAGLLALSACDAPSPVATVTVNSDTVNSEASCWNDGKAIDDKELTSCLQDKDVPTLKVNQDETVRFGVDQEIAESRWVILMNGRPLVEDSGRTYRTIPGSVFFDPQYGAQGNSTVVAIRALDEDDKARTTGLWTFKLKRGDDS
ncbi:DUF2771 domain-containing protein [Streptomyces fragilis]|uniref:DUF2771 domain-containing protein n=1 Tax=Streptomyces fragilis TaxID=67301 RepID=A0ABV2YCW1_9ACTN|nr:DUF2771 domain-containing protein [Streptomyces fragilis]